MLSHSDTGDLGKDLLQMSSGILLDGIEAPKDQFHNGAIQEPRAEVTENHRGSEECHNAVEPDDLPAIDGCGESQ